MSDTPNTWPRRFTEFHECYVVVELHGGSKMRGDCEVDSEFVTLLGDCCDDKECDLTVISVINKKSIAAMRMSVVPVDVEDDPGAPPKPKTKEHKPS